MCASNTQHESHRTSTLSVCPLGIKKKTMYSPPNRKQPTAYFPRYGEIQAHQVSLLRGVSQLAFEQQTVAQ